VHFEADAARDGSSGAGYVACAENVQPLCARDGLDEDFHAPPAAHAQIASEVALEKLGCPAALCLL
jgi:hypothetical protein